MFLIILIVRFCKQLLLNLQFNDWFKKQYIIQVIFLITGKKLTTKLCYHYYRINLKKNSTKNNKL